VFLGKKLLSGILVSINTPAIGFVSLFFETVILSKQKLLYNIS